LIIKYDLLYRKKYRNQLPHEFQFSQRRHELASNLAVMALTDIVNVSRMSMRATYEL